MTIFTMNECDYVIVRETIMIVPEYDCSGNLYSRVVEGNDSFIVKKKPWDLVNDSLKTYCSDLPGAIKGSKSIIGNCHMPPIRINGMPDMYWFPHTSPNDNDCVWLALHHILTPIPISKKRTKVITTHGHSIVLNLEIKKFEVRMSKAEQLQAKMQKKKNTTHTLFFLPKSSIHFIKEKGTNYCIKKEDKE